MQKSKAGKEAWPGMGSAGPAILGEGGKRGPGGRKRAQLEKGRGTIALIRGEEAYTEYLLANFEPVLKLMGVLDSRQIGRIDERVKEKAFGKLLRAAEASPERFKGMVMRMAAVGEYNNRVRYFFETEGGERIARAIGFGPEELLEEIDRKKGPRHGRGAGNGA
ncbi:MAG: hypothetical protein PHF51_01585 [Candidatus ainarchaeum sp.]|nr:hypothetical protein [Candidatus ainarchaeum sp.]